MAAAPSADGRATQQAAATRGASHGTEGSNPPARTMTSVDRDIPPIAPLEDERGVDVAQIRALLALTPQQRVERLVEVVAAWTAIRGHARASTARG